MCQIDHRNVSQVNLSYIRNKIVESCQLITASSRTRTLSTVRAIVFKGIGVACAGASSTAPVPRPYMETEKMNEFTIIILTRLVQLVMIIPVVLAFRQLYRDVYDNADNDS